MTDAPEMIWIDWTPGDDDTAPASIGAHTARSKHTPVGDVVEYRRADLPRPEDAARIAELEAGLLDPVAVHLNMLRGGIAKPSWAQIEHLYPDETAATRADITRLEAALAGARVAALDEALNACLNFRNHGGGSDAEKIGAMECALAISDIRIAARAALKGGEG
jgi:hypothetical protein